MAEDLDTGGPAAEALGDVTKVNDGQIALSARNEGDGTWSVRLGPGGPILKEGLPREKALGIVGAPTPPYEPANKQEQELADLRVECEDAAREYANKEALKSDEDLGLVDGRGRRVFDDEPEAVRVGSTGATTSGSDEASKLSDENADLRRDIASKDETIRQLEAQVAKFDEDGDGKTGGRKPKAKPEAIAADATPPDGVEGAEKNGGE